MSMPVTKSESIALAPPRGEGARVLPLRLQPRPLLSRLAAVARTLAVRVIPPALVLAFALLVWELLCRRAGATLPPPSAVLRDTWELIVDPFFDRGGIDKGLFWHLSASLQRVAFGYALASVAGRSEERRVGKEWRSRRAAGTAR